MQSQWEHPQSNNHQATPKITINKALFIETGTYNDMSLRPYQTNLTDRTLGMFQEATHNGESISAAAISGISNSIITPSANAGERIQVPGGWSEPRLRFILDITERSSIGGHGTRKILQGYTDYVGVNFNTASVDPNMSMFFNSVVTLRETYQDTPFGNNVRSAISESNHLLRGDYNPAANWGNEGAGRNTNSMRPEDVFATMGRMDLGLDDVTDTRSTFAEFPVKKSKRSNASTANYVADILKGYRGAYDSFSPNESDGMGSLMQAARGTVAENLMATDPFFELLQRMTSNFVNGGFVSYGELASVIPEFDSQVNIMPSSQVAKQSAHGFENHRAGDTEHWNGSTLETTWATGLSASVPSLMMDLMLTGIYFQATNATLNGRVETKILNVMSFAEGIDLTPYLNNFQMRLETEVLQGLSLGNTIDYQITMRVDIAGETRVTVALHGDPHGVEYSTPSFADGLFVPVITNESQNLDTVAHDLHTLSDNLGTQRTENYSHTSSWGDGI